MARWIHIDEVIAKPSWEEEYAPPLYLLKNKGKAKIYHLSADIDHNGKDHFQGIKQVLAQLLILKNQFPLYLHVEVFPEWLEEWEREKIDCEILPMQDFHRKDIQVVKITIENHQMLQKVIELSYCFATYNFLYAWSFRDPLPFHISNKGMGGVVPIFDLKSPASYITADEDAFHVEVVTNEPEWMDIHRFAADLAKSVGAEVTVGSGIWISASEME